MRLVLVEGFPGSGKSTTTQWLALAWRRQGVACRWTYEQQPDHPVSRALGPGGYGTWEEWAEERLGLLRRDVPPGPSGRWTRGSPIFVSPIRTRPIARLRLEAGALVLDGLLWPANRLPWKGGDAPGAAEGRLTVNLDV